MKKLLGINFNKNLAKKGTIIALALAVVIGMSYFSSQDYLNQSIMDMLMGETTDETWGQQIANGHAFDDHAAEFDVSTREEFADIIDGIIMNPSESKELDRDRTAYWDEEEQAIVITDPNSDDGGTAYVPTDGKAAYDRL